MIVLPTKLELPLPHSDLVQRPRLLERLEMGLGSALMLVFAPAGFGKTTLISGWVRHGDRRCAWLSLDEADNDPVRFLQVLIAALQHLNPFIGISAQAVLFHQNTAHQASNLASDSLAGPLELLMADILQYLRSPFLLILDDYHVIREPFIHQMMKRLLYHVAAAPSSDGQSTRGTIVLITRAAPPLALARLRSMGQLFELRMDDLRFTMQETATFLNEHSDLQLPLRELETLHVRTEGWVAALRLLITSLKGLPNNADRTMWITHLATNGTHIFDYLAEEVLSHVEPELRRFLLETSILAELTPVLCQAVTGRYDSAEFLRTLYRRALFCSPTDVTGTIYCYHPLFAEFLRQRLHSELPEQIATLHHRAADAQLGSERAIGHYLAARAWQAAAHTIAALGDTRIDLGLLETVEGWIATIPPAVRDDHPWLIYLQGRIAWQRGNFARAEALLLSALAEFERQNDTVGVDRALVHVAGVLTSQYDLVRAPLFVERALARPIALRDRVRLLQVRVYLYLYQGDWLSVRRDVLTAISLVEGAGELALYHLLLPGLSGFLVHLPGMLDPLEQVCHQALDRLGATPSPASAAALNLLGYIRLLRGQVAESMQLAGRARAMIKQLGAVDPWIGMDQDVLLTYHSLLNGDIPHVISHWQHQLVQYAQAPATRPWLPLAHYFLARVHAQAEMPIYRNHLTLLADMCADEDYLPESRLALLFLRTLVAMTEQRHADAEQALAEATTIQENLPHTRFIGSARLWYVYLYEQMGRSDDACDLLLVLLAECQQAGMPGLILREARLVVSVLERLPLRSPSSTLASALLATLNEVGKPRPIAVPGSGEMLTVREIEVLRLLARGASNQEIAVQLVISVSTAKAHVSNIIAKLGVASRSAAVARARAIQLL